MRPLTKCKHSMLPFVLQLGVPFFRSDLPPSVSFAQLNIYARLKVRPFLFYLSAPSRPFRLNCGRSSNLYSALPFLCCLCLCVCVCVFTTPSRSSTIRRTTTLSSILTPLLLCACSAVLLLVSLCPHVCLLRCQLVLERCVSLFVTLPLSLALLPCFLESCTMCFSLLSFFFFLLIGSGVVFVCLR